MDEDEDGCGDGDGDEDEGWEQVREGGEDVVDYVILSKSLR